MIKFKKGQCRNIGSPIYQVFGQFFLFFLEQAKRGFARSRMVLLLSTPLINCRQEVNNCRLVDRANGQLRAS